MKKQSSKETHLLDAEEWQMRRLLKSAGCRFNKEGVVCGLWKKEPSRCDRCGWNPNKGKERPAP